MRDSLGCYGCLEEINRGDGDETVERQCGSVTLRSRAKRERADVAVAVRTTALNRGRFQTYSLIVLVYRFIV